MLETEARMMPGAIICIRLVAADAVFLLRGRVLRSHASSFRGALLLYESAIAFDEEFPLLANDSAFLAEAAASAEPTEAAPQTQEAAANSPEMKPVEDEEYQPATFTVTIPVPESGPDLRQIFGLNQW